MDIIKRNFFCLLRSGALNEYAKIEPMSRFKWRRLIRLLESQHVLGIAAKGVRNHQYDEGDVIPRDIFDELIAEAEAHVSDEATDTANSPKLSNSMLNRRLHHIRTSERHAIDTSLEALQLLDLIVANLSCMLNKGISLKGILDIGSFLRTRGDKVDFVKLDNWLNELHIQRFAQLEGSILIAVFNFEQDEVPFVQKIEPAAGWLTLRTLTHTTLDTAEEWHFRQSKTGFVKNNSKAMRRNLRRSMRYLEYGPVETASNFFRNFTRSLSEIEE